MSYYKYKNKRLFVENKSILSLSKRIKTPFYLYSGSQLKNNYLNFTKIFKKINPLICFSVKSNSNPFILKSLKNLGSGADVVSSGELLKALKAGIKPNKIVFSGVGKSEEEIKLAINNKILLINIESESEAILINKISKKGNKKTSVGLRLNPNVYTDTHRKISTGSSTDKFGLSKQELISLCKKISNFKNIKLDAISVHIGSQILSDKPFRKSLNIIADIINKTKIKLKFVDLGGGFGISYNKKDKKINLSRYSNLVNNFKNSCNEDDTNIQSFSCVAFKNAPAVYGNVSVPVVVNVIEPLVASSPSVFTVLKIYWLLDTPPTPKVFTPFLPVGVTNVLKLVSSNEASALSSNTVIFIKDWCTSPSIIFPFVPSVINIIVLGCSNRTGRLGSPRTP